MKQNYKRKLLAGILSVCMMFQTAGTVPAYAVGNAADSGLPIGTSSVCTHHAHDEKCGYTEGTPCTHVHTDECYTKVTKCVHEHTAECYSGELICGLTEEVVDSGSSSDAAHTHTQDCYKLACTHICDEASGCITKELACKHVHDDTCGYKEGTPCTFDTATCESCNPKNTADNIVPLAEGEVYAVYDGSNFCLAEAGDHTKPTTTGITDKTTINHLYINVESVPVELMSGWYTCAKLKTVTCADTVTTIGNNAFKDCTSLASVAMPKVTTIGEYAFFQTALTSVSMPEATKIDKYAFSKTALTSVSMPSATKIGDSAFSDCAKLESVEMPNVTTIVVEAFYNCIKLASVAMPKVTKIGGGAFNGCTSLASLTLGATPPATVGTDAFGNCPKTNALTIQGNTAYATEVLAAYNTAAASDGAADELWYGWTLPTALDGTGVSNSAGTLEVTTGNANPTVGTNNAITLTATFDKAAKIGRQGALAINEVEFKDATTSLGTATATQNADGKWVATLNVNTKDWAGGAHKLTAEYAGNNELGGSTTNEVTVTVNEVYAVYDGSKFYAATASAPSTATEIVITDKKTINNLYIKGASVPQSLMLSYTNLKTVICAETVTEINNNAFNGCTGITSVAMPNVNYIYNNAFNGCTGITSVAMPKVTNILMYAFNGCTKLTSVVLPEATIIGNNAFDGCTSLASASIPKVAKINNSTFNRCSGLKSVEMPSATNIGTEAFMGCEGLTGVELPSATNIGGRAFYACKKLTSLTLGATPPATVGTDAFAHCPTSRTLTIQGDTANSATVLGAYKAVTDGNPADDNWYGWTLPAAMVATPSAGTLEITTGNVATIFGTDNTITLTATFDKATNVGKQRALATNKVEFKNGTTALGTAIATKNADGKWVATLDVNTKGWAVGAHNLTATFTGSHELGASTTNGVTFTVNESYAVYDGINNKFYAATQIDQTTPTTTEITDKKTINNLYIMGASVPQNLMLDCANLKTVICANTVTTIGNAAFTSCTSLASVAMPKVTNIGDNALANCANLTSVALPKVNTIGNQAFYNCTSLASLTLGEAPPTTVGTDAFMSCPKTNGLTIQGNTANSGAVLAAYKAVTDGNPADDNWYGWTLPVAMVATPSAGTLAVTTGKAASNFGQDNAITLTATFDIATNIGKQRALANNQVQFKDGTTALGAIATPTQNTEGKWVATINVNTKDWAVGAHNLTAEYTGNPELGASTTNEMTFIQGEELNASDGFIFNSTSDEGIYKAGTGTITFVKAAGKYQFTFTDAVVASTALNAITLPTDAPVEVKLVGTSTISSTNTGTESSGIYIGNGSNVTLLGDGTLTSAINYTVSVKSANLTMEGGTVINTKESGTTIFADGANVKTAINGGTVQSTAKGSHAIQYGYNSAGGTLTISQPQGKTTLITSANNNSQNDSNIPTIYIGPKTTVVNISGGTIENTTGNMAIVSYGTVTVTGTPSINGLVSDYRKGAEVTYNNLSFYGTAYTLKGSLDTDDIIFMVNVGQTLTIPKGLVLTITERYNPSYIQNNGTIKNEGAIIAEVKGNAVQGSGTVTKKGKITFSLTDSKGKPLTNPTYGDTVTITATLEEDTAARRAMQRAGTAPTFELMLFKDSEIFNHLGEMTYTKDTKGVYTAKKEVKLHSNIAHGYGSGALTAGANYQFACDFSGDELLLQTSGKSKAFNITQKELTISGLTPQNRVYDEYNPSVTLTGTAALEGIEAADTGNVMLQNANITQGELENNYAGMGKKVTIVPQYLSGSAGQNYSLNTTLIETVDISRADNSITNRSTTSKYYGESFRIEYNIVNTDITQPTFTCEYKEGSAADSAYTTTLPTNAGNYTMRVSATETQNYNACSVAQNFEIKKAPLNVTGGTAEPKKWDGTKAATVTGLTFKNAFTYTSLVGDEALVIGKDFTVTKAEYATANVNMNIIHATVALQSTTKANNYFLPLENGGVFPFEGTPIALADGPATPTFSAMDDEMGKDTFTFNSIGATVYEYSKDSGATWTEITASGATTSINIGNIALAAGALQVRVKATDTHNASGVLTNTAAQVFTVSIDGSVSLNKTTGVTYGDTITATVSGQQSGAALKYQWKADNAAISGETASTLKVPGSAVGKTITVEVTATGYNGNLTTATSAVAKKAVTATAGTVSKVYDGTSAVETADRTLTITKVNADDDITITAANAVYNDANVGTGKAITLGALSISGTEADWYAVTASTTVTGEITAKTLTGATVTVGGSYIYTGSAITPTAENVTVKDGTTTLTNGTDYAFEATDNTSAGTATLTVTFKGNYYGTASTTFTIAKADPTYNIPTGLTAKYGETLSAANIGATIGFSWMDGTRNVGAAGTQTHKAKFTPDDLNNYNIVNDIDVTVTVEKATPTVAVTAEKKVSRRLSLGNHEDTITLKATVTGVAGGTVPMGTITFKSGATTIASDVNVTNGVATYDWVNPDAATYTITAEFAATADTNYGNATGTSTDFDINKAEQKALNIINVPKSVTYGDSNFTLSTTGGSGTGDITYTVSVGDAVSVMASTGAVTVLKAGTATITATKAGDTNYNAKTDTVAITVQSAKPTVTWGTTEQSTTYTGSPVLASVLTAPTVTLVKGETYDSSKIQYAYKKTGSFSLFAGYTDGLPTAAGKYEIKAKIAAEGNYTQAETATALTLTINKSTPSITINTMNDKTYDGTAMANPTAADMSITGTNYADVKFAYSKNSNMSSATINAPKDAGTYYVRANVLTDANTNPASSTAVSFTIAKANVSGILQEYPVVKTLAKEYSFDLNKLLPSISSTQEYGSVTYAVSSTSNANSVLTAVPTNSDIAKGKLALKVANVEDKDKTATVSISITTDNFTVANAVITVKTVDKTPLTISGAAMAERVYNGSAYAYTGTPTFTNTTDNKAVTGVSFTTEYEGRNSTNYTKGEAAPTNAGEYNLILTVSGASADTYAGTLTVPFAITQKQVTVKAKDKDILAGAEIPSLANPAVNTDYTTDGFIGKDTLTGTVSMSYTGTPDNTKQGLYPITISGGTVSDNYAVKYESGTLTISIDVSLITAGITAANNAKGGIAIYDIAASSVANGTKFVTTAEMNTLNTAIQTATDAKASCTTLAQVQAVVKALDDAVANFKAAIKTGTYTAPTTEPTPAPTASPTTTPTPAPTPKATDGGNDTQDQKPTAGKTTAAAEVDADGKATVTVPEKSITDAITKAQDEAKKNGTEENGIAVEIEVTGDENTNSISTTLSEESIKELVDAGVKEVTFKSEMGDITIDLETLQQIQKEQGGDITITVSEADISAFDEKLKKEIGDRPVYELSITRADGTRVTDFDGSITIAIPYTLQEGEDPENIAVVYINENGEKEVMIGSGYDEKTQSAIFTTRHFSTFAIVLMQDKNDAPITDIEQADKTNQDVGSGTETTDTQGGISTGIMVTIVIAGILAIAMVAVGVYAIVKKRRE